MACQCIFDDKSRVIGVNWVYVEAMLVLHAVWSKDRVGLAVLGTVMVVLLVLFAILVRHRMRRNIDMAKEREQGSVI